jgi:hypothetical protein
MDPISVSKQACYWSYSSGKVFRQRNYLPALRQRLESHEIQQVFIVWAG